MARLYSNENFPLPVVEELRKLGHDVLTIQDTGRAGQKTPDRDVVAFAKTERRSLLTINRRDFARLHRQDPNHPGMILCTLDTDFAGQAKRIDQAILGEGSLEGKILRVNRPPS